ncbi:MAG TPA: hypothetical protein VJH23_01065 [archaeon]|nr:hypothetical protein [archaeon]
MIRVAFAAFLVLSILSGCAAPSAEQSVDEQNAQTESPQSQAPSEAAPADAAPAASAPKAPDAGIVAKNTALSSALATGGIADAAVDVQNNLILMAFELPSGMIEENAAFYAIGAATNLADNGQDIKVEVFSGAQSTIYSVSSAEAKKFVAGETTAGQFRLSLKKT